MKLLIALLGQKTAIVNRVVKKSPDGRVTSVKPIECAVHQVLSESELASKYRQSYRRLYVQDFTSPTPREVDHFLEIVKRLPRDKWIYVHCHAGVGRTTTFMAMFDMLRNAKTASFEAILERQRAIGGKDFNLLPNKNSFKYLFAEDRFVFLKKFYDYARTNKDGFTTTWSSWLAKN